MSTQRSMTAQPVCTFDLEIYAACLALELQLLVGQPSALEGWDHEITVGIDAQHGGRMVLESVNP